MADDIDRAGPVIEAAVDNGTAAARAKALKPGMGSPICDCGAEIPAGRYQLGANTCIDCAEREERRTGLYRT